MSNFENKSPLNFWMVRQLDTYMVGHKGFIAGGVFKNIFNKEKFKDIDIFFENEKDFLEAVSYYEDNIDYVLYYKNKKVHAFKNTRTNHVVELCKHVFGKPEDIISNFDFSITKIAYYKEYVEDEEDIKTEYALLHHKDFFEHLYMKRLVLESNIKFPISTFERSLRYTKYGYGLCKESKINLLNAIRSFESKIEISDELYNGID